MICAYVTARSPYVHGDRFVIISPCVIVPANIGRRGAAQRMNAATVVSSLTYGDVRRRSGLALAFKHVVFFFFSRARLGGRVFRYFTGPPPS